MKKANCLRTRGMCSCSRLLPWSTVLPCSSLRKRVLPLKSPFSSTSRRWESTTKSIEASTRQKSSSPSAPRGRECPWSSSTRITSISSSRELPSWSWPLATNGTTITLDKLNLLPAKSTRKSTLPSLKWPKIPSELFVLDTKNYQLTTTSRKKTTKECISAKKNISFY